MSAPEPLLQTRKIGSWTVHAIQAGGQMLDGGAMFGVVPKVLWERRIPADARNRIPMGMRCLLIEHDVGLILLDTGGYASEHECRSAVAILQENAGWASLSPTS